MKCGTYVVYMVREPGTIVWRGVPSMLSGGFLKSERSRLVSFQKFLGRSSVIGQQDIMVILHGQ